MKFNYKSLFFLSFFLFLLILQTTLTAVILKENYLNRLADAFLHGQLNFLNPINAQVDLSFFNNKYFWPGGPLSGIILMPFVFLFGVTYYTTGVLAIVINLINIFLVYKLACKLGIKEKQDALWLTAFYIFGTAYFFVSLSLFASWFIQLLATLFLLLALYEFFERQKWWLIGVFIGLGGLTRPTIYFASLFFLCSIFFDQATWKEKNKKIIFFSLPILASVIIFALYNYFRFNNFLEIGYNFQILGADLINLRNNLGLFNWRYIPINLHSFLLRGLDLVLVNGIPKFPFFRANSWGLGLIFISPALLYVFKAPWKQEIVKYAWFTILLIISVLMTSFLNGVVQFGYRYILDFLPFLFLLLIFGLRPTIGWKVKTLIFFGILFDLYLVMAA